KSWWIPISTAGRARAKASSRPIAGWATPHSRRRSMAAHNTPNAIMPEPTHPAAHDKLKALGIVALNGMFDEMDALGVLRYAVSDVLPGDLAIVSSFGADSAVLLHMVSQVDPAMPVYFLETGKHFPETLAYVETLKKQFGLINIHAIQPDPADIKRF